MNFIYKCAWNFINNKNLSEKYRSSNIKCTTFVANCVNVYLDTNLVLNYDTITLVLKKLILKTHMYNINIIILYIYMKRWSNYYAKIFRILIFQCWIYSTISILRLLKSIFTSFHAIITAILVLFNTGARGSVWRI